MAKENRQQLSTTDSRRNIRVYDKITTTDATPIIIASITLGENRGSFIRVEGFAKTTNLSAMQAVSSEAGFRRQTGGNVIRSTSNNGLNSPPLISSGDLSGVAPTIDLVANTTTQTIDIVAKGKAGVTLQWHLMTTSLQNLT